MGIFSKKEGLKVVEQVRKSFEKVRNDFSEIVDWLHYFHRRHEEHDIRLRLVEDRLSYLPKNTMEIRQITAAVFLDCGADALYGQYCCTIDRASLEQLQYMIRIIQIITVGLCANGYLCSK